MVSKIKVIDYFFLLFIAFGGWLSFFFLNDIEASFVLKVLYIILNGYVLLFIKKKYGTYITALTLFLLFVLLFNGSRIILDLFGYDNMRELYYISQVTITEENNNRAILNVILAIVFLCIGYFLYNKKAMRNNTKEFEFPNYILIPLLIIGFIAKIYVAYLSFSFVSMFSYGDVFTEGIPIPTYLSILSYLPVVVCLYKFKSRKVGFWFFLIILYSLLSMSTGQRGPGMILIFMSLFVCVKLGHIRIKKYYLLLLIPLVVMLMLAIGFVRRDNDIEFENDFLIAFFWGQSVSIDVLQLAIQDYDKLNYVFFDLFGNIRYTLDRMTIYRGMSQDPLVEMAKYKMWSSYITYYTSPNFYFQGMGLGGNYIGQAFAVGKEVCVIPISFLIGFFLHYVENKVFSNNIYISFISFSVLQSLLYIPRDNLFDFVTDLRLPLFTLTLVYFIQFSLKLYSNEKQ